MFVEKIKTEGLAHLSYVVGDGAEAAVIDPRRDCAVYVDVAARHGARITAIFETHRNEDLVSGAAALAELTGAPVHHGPNPAAPVRYADTVREGDAFAFGDLELKVLETPGHTDDSLSFAISDRSFGAEAVGVFTGDALFIGDVGRTDFYPDRAEEVAGLLFDSLRKLLALGDQAIVYPAHGAGSVCGSGMAAREFSTLGYERHNNPLLRIEDRAEFIARKLGEHHYQPPYFRTMERLNLEGAALPARPPVPPALTTEAAMVRLQEGCVPVDVRPFEAYCAAHLPGALCLPADMIAAFAGWLLAEHDNLLLIADDEAQAGEAAIQLARIGYDNVVGYLPGVVGWVTDGRDFATLPFIDAEAVAARRKRPNGWELLDVRGIDEVEDEKIAGARHLYVGELPDRHPSLARDRAYTLMCGSGARASIAAGVLQRAGFDRVDVFLGSMSAWRERAAG